ncbi:RecX family transcriptional regulator [Hydrogenibacillus sp. N12]|uniref:regulatory protein RecX n=1 Tax=Hydrogenibacillus sp. N12 TaxID=2866627 RepID=UPI001C7CC36A|nr:RecX family transcriptional regulator [Hydrogenibacillus sp. N12]QZA33734.1 RecX family transcriptional regulator [Hydrogenibacillus sp. N12]
MSDERSEHREASDRVEGVRRIVALTERRRAVEIALDDESRFVVDVETAVRLGLRVGRALGPNDFAALAEEERRSAAYRRALFFLAYRSRSAAEVRAALARSGYGDVAEAIVARLQAEGYLDDRRFAREWVQGRLAGRPRSRAALRSELRRLGVPEDAVREALEDVDDDAELKAAIRLARAAWEKSRNDPPLRRRQRVMAKLYRHGFSPDVAALALRQAMADAGEEDEAAPED